MKLCIHDCHGKCYHPCQNKGKWIQAALFWPTRCFAWREQQQELFEIICWTCCLVQLQKGSNQLQYSATHDPARTPQRPQEPIPPTVSEVCMVKHGRTCHVVKVISNGFACRLHSISQQCIRKCLYTPVTLRCVHGLTLPMLAGGGHCLWLSMKCDGWRLDHRERDDQISIHYGNEVLSALGGSLHSTQLLLSCSGWCEPGDRRRNRGIQICFGSLVGTIWKPSRLRKVFICCGQRHCRLVLTAQRVRHEAPWLAAGCRRSYFLFVACRAKPCYSAGR